MSGAGKKGTTAGKIPRWEAELWSYVSQGDGIHCPLPKPCSMLQKEGGWCPEEQRENLNLLLDEEKFDFQDYDFIRSEAQAQGLCRLYKLVEKLAGVYLKKYCETEEICQPPVSTRLIALFDQQHNIEIRQLPLKAYHGAIWHHQNEWIIQVNDSDTAPTMRFTVFHEAFHILAHSRTTPVFRKRGSIVGSFNEWMADYFAACILMPREWLLEKWAEVEDLDRIAEIFAVSKPAMCIRLRQLSLI